MAEEKKTGPYKAEDMVKVADSEGNVQPDPVPAAWVGTDLLPPGTKKATKAQVDKAEGSDAGGDSGDSDSGS